MDTTHRRFSLVRTAGDFKRMLQEHWLGLLMASVLIGLFHALVGELWAQIYEPSLNDAPGSRTLWSIAERLLRVATEALCAGVVLSIALGDGRQPLRNVVGALRAATVRFPAVAPPFLLAALPILANILLTAMWLADPTVIPDVNKVAFASAAAGLVGLMVFAFVGLAPAIAIRENAGPLVAIRRSIALVNGRSFVLFALSGAVLLALFLSLSATFLLADLPFPWPWLAWVWPAVGAILKFVGLSAAYLEFRRLSTVEPSLAQPLTSP